MRILVTGGAGFIGSHTAKALAQQGDKPVVLDNLSAGSREAVRWGPLIVGDVGDSDLVRSVIREHGIEAVIHFAAYTAVGESMGRPAAFFRNNLINTAMLLDVMLAEGVDMMVFSSSCAVYGPPETTPINEDHPRRPISPYAESKLMVEQMLRWYGELSGLRWAALRYFNAAGADPDGDLGERHDPETHLIPLVIQAAIGKLPELQIFGTDYPTPDGTAVRDYTHVSDLAAAHVDALRHLRSSGESIAVNIGSGRGYSVREIIDVVERVGGRPVPTRDAPRRAGDPPALIADNRLARETFGWKPCRSDIETIIRSAWEWHTRERDSRQSPQ